MPTLSASKQNQITNSLIKHGVQPTSNAIAKIVEALEEDGRIAIGTAVKRYAESVGHNHATQNPLQTAASKQNQMLDVAARQYADRLKAEVERRAQQFLMEDIESGDIGFDFGGSLTKSFAAFGEAVEVEYKAIAGGGNLPLSLAAATEREDID